MHTRISTLLMQMAMDPTVNINWGAPVRLPKYKLEDMFDEESVYLKEAFGVKSDEEWQVNWLEQRLFKSLKALDAFSQTLQLC